LSRQHYRYSSAGSPGGSGFPARNDLHHPAVQRRRGISSKTLRAAAASPGAGAMQLRGVLIQHAPVISENGCTIVRSRSPGVTYSVEQLPLFSAGSQRPPSSAANRNPLRPCTPPGSMEWFAANMAPSERWRSGWDHEFESPLLQGRVHKPSVPRERSGSPRAQRSASLL
jgi:hypothetical protein